MRQTTRVPLDDLERGLTRETLSELVDRGFSDEEMAEFIGESCTICQIKQARNRLGIKHQSRGTGKPRSGSLARKLWEMDAGDL